MTYYWEVTKSRSKPMPNQESNNQQLSLKQLKTSSMLLCLVHLQKGCSPRMGMKVGNSELRRVHKKLFITLCITL